jgi:hypothetical protein
LRSWRCRSRRPPRSGFLGLESPLPETCPRACLRWGCPALRLRDVEGTVPLAAGCLLLAGSEGPCRGNAFDVAANLLASLGHGYPRGGWLVQHAHAGERIVGARGRARCCEPKGSATRSAGSIGSRHHWMICWAVLRNNSTILQSPTCAVGQARPGRRMAGSQHQPCRCEPAFVATQFLSI